MVPGPSAAAPLPGPYLQCLGSGEPGRPLVPNSATKSCFSLAGERGIFFLGGCRKRRWVPVCRGWGLLAGLLAASLPQFPRPDLPSPSLPFPEVGGPGHPAGPQSGPRATADGAGASASPRGSRGRRLPHLPQGKWGRCPEREGGNGASWGSSRAEVVGASGAAGRAPGFTSACGLQTAPEFPLSGHLTAQAQVLQREIWIRMQLLSGLGPIPLLPEALGGDCRLGRCLCAHSSLVAHGQTQ